VHAVLPVGLPAAALLVSWVASLAAAWGVSAAVATRYGRRAGIVSAALWGTLPHSVLMNIAYTEALFSALAAWSLWAALTRRWLWAGTLSSLSCLTRPTGIAVAAAVCAAAAVELLRRTLEEAVPLSRDERDLVERAVEERRCALEALYVRERCATAVEELARRFGGPTEAGRPEGQEIRLDWTPDGWEPDHWLRATLAGGTLRVATMYCGGPGERTPEQRALDDARCAETHERLAELQRIVKDMVVDVEFEVQTQGALPGVPGENALTLDGLDETDTGRSLDAHQADTHQAGPRHRTVDGDGHR